MPSQAFGDENKESKELYVTLMTNTIVGIFLFFAKMMFISENININIHTEKRMEKNDFFMKMKISR